MSLFKAREWWSTVCGEREEFDRGCLCVGNIDNEPNNKSGILFDSISLHRCCYDHNGHDDDDGDDSTVSDCLTAIRYDTFCFF